MRTQRDDEAIACDVAPGESYVAEWKRCGWVLGLVLRRCGRGCYVWLGGGAGCRVPGGRGSRTLGFAMRCDGVGAGL